jgi:hypothetical protein
MFFGAEKLLARQSREGGLVPPPLFDLVPQIEFTPAWGAGQSAGGNLRQAQTGMKQSNENRAMKKQG